MAGLYGRYDALNKMLDKIEFSDEDVLYLIGDVIDYSFGSIDIIEKCMKHKNIHLILGEHEQMMLKAIETLNNHQREVKEDRISDDWFEIVNDWVCRGGDVTLVLLMEDEMKLESILEYMATRPTYIELNDYILTHGCLIELNDMPEGIYNAINDIGFCISHSHLENYHKKVIVGHTPTQAIINNPHPNEIYSKGNVTNIYTDTNDSGRLACLRLDDMKTYYIDKDEYKGEEDPPF